MKVLGCVCDNDTVLEMGPEDKTVLKRPFYEHSDGKKTDDFQCFHVCYTAFEM